MAILDISPVREGHTLVISTAHAPKVSDLDDEPAARLFAVGRWIANALYEALNCDGVNWLVADGEAAGQEVPHLHLHLIPRYLNDGLGPPFPRGYGEPPTREALDRTASAIRSAIKQ